MESRKLTEEEMEMYSDLHKEIRGMRPSRYTNWEELTVGDLEALENEQLADIPF